MTGPLGDWGRKLELQLQQSKPAPGAGSGCAEGKLQIWVKLPGGRDESTQIPQD